jgi:hypothetical protein
MLTLLEIVAEKVINFLKTIVSISKSKRSSQIEELFLIIQPFFNIFKG